MHSYIFMNVILLHTYFKAIYDYLSSHLIPALISNRINPALMASVPFPSNFRFQVELPMDDVAEFDWYAIQEI